VPAERSGSGSSMASANPQIYKDTQGLPNDQCSRKACVGSDGNVARGRRRFAGSASGTDRDFRKRALASIPADAGVRECCARATAPCGSATNIGLIQVRNGAERLFTTKDGMVDNWIVDLSTSADGSLWIGTRNGFSRFRKGEFENFRPQDGFRQSTFLFRFSEDREGSLWVGTKHGLNQFIDGRAVPSTSIEGLPSKRYGPPCSRTATARSGPELSVCRTRTFRRTSFSKRPARISLRMTWSLWRRTQAATFGSARKRI